MKKVKKIIATLLTVIMAAVCVPITAIPAYAQEHTIESISAEYQSTLIEEADGYWVEEWTEEGYDEYFQYSINNQYFEFTVTYDGGNVIQGNWYVIEQQLGMEPYTFDVNSNQSYENQWCVGTHTVEVSFLGQTCQTEIEVVENPIESITAIANKPLIEGVDGRYETFDGPDRSYFRYNLFPEDIECTVTYSDGQVYQGLLSNLPQEYGMYVAFYDNQSYENQWGVGTHTVDIVLMGRTCQTEIEIQESPIISYTVTPQRPFYKNIDGKMTVTYEFETDTTTDEFFCYDFDPGLFNYSLTTNQGQSFSGTYSELKEYVADLFACSTMNIYIKTNQNFSNQWNEGSHIIEFHLFGKRIDVPIVIEEKYTGISISGENELEVSLLKADGTIDKTKALGYYFSTRAGAYLLETELGVFPAVMYCDENGMIWQYDKNVCLSLGLLESNVLEKNTWSKIDRMSQLIAAYVLCYSDNSEKNINSFDGIISEELIDRIITLAFTVMTGNTLQNGFYEYKVIGREQYYLIDESEVMAIVSAVFDDAGLDYSKAKRDEESGKIMVNLHTYGGPFGENRSVYDENTGEWISTFQYQSSPLTPLQRVTTVFDENEKVKTISLSHQHTMNFCEGAAANCAKEGTLEHYECSFCGRLFADAMGEEEIDQSEIEIPASGHNYSETVIPPTASEQGYTLHTCTNCGDEYRDTFVPSVTPRITVSDSVGVPGKTVSVDISIENNPGIMVARLALAYDQTKLQLLSASDTALLNGGEVFGGDLSAIPYYLYWDDSLATDNNTQNGVIATLTFQVLEDSPLGDTDVTVTYLPDNIYDKDLDNVSFEIDNGNVTIREVVLGDADGNGSVGPKDVTALRRYLAGGWNVIVDALAADVNQDGTVNPKDVTMLRRYLAGGYGIVLE